MRGLSANKILNFDCFFLFCLKQGVLASGEFLNVKQVRTVKDGKES